MNNTYPPGGLLRQKTTFKEEIAEILKINHSNGCFYWAEATDQIIQSLLNRLPKEEKELEWQKIDKLEDVREIVLVQGRNSMLKKITEIINI